LSREQLNARMISPSIQLSKKWVILYIWLIYRFVEKPIWY
jgi:hypothetical protein